MIKTILVGFGWWGRHMSARLNPSSGFSLAAVVEPDAANHNDIAALNVPAYSSLTQALEETACDAVVLTSPNPLHDEQVQLCVNARKHVFCEKPLSLTGRGAQQSVDACRDAGVVLGIGHERRFEPALQQVSTMLHRDELGVPMHAEAAFSHDKLRNLSSDNWRTKKSIAPAAGMTGMGIHLTDLFIWMFGSVTEVQAMTSDRTLGWETGDVVTAQFRFKSGMTATLSAILNTPHFMRYQVFGSEAWVEVRNDSHPDTPGGLSRLTHSVGAQPVAEQAFDWCDTPVRNLDAFGAAVRGELAYPYSDFELVHNVEVLEAIAQSAETTQTVRLDNER